MVFNSGIHITTKRLLICGQAAGIFFIVLFLIQGQLRVGYSALRFPVSSLSIGHYGWIQRVNFLVSGSLIVLFAFGFRQATPLLKNSTWTSRLIGIVGLGLIGAGIFSSDAIYGYPMTEPLKLAQFTMSGHLHDLFSIFVFASLPIVCFKMSKRFREFHTAKWATYTLFSAIGMIVFFVLAAMGFKQVTGLVNFAGVFQRLSIITGFTWLTALSSMIMHTSRRV